MRKPRLRLNNAIEIVDGWKQRIRWGASGRPKGRPYQPTQTPWSANHGAMIPEYALLFRVRSLEFSFACSGIRRAARDRAAQGHPYQRGVMTAVEHHSYGGEMN